MVWGGISKVILDQINSNILRRLNFNQWKNIGNVLDWFKSIKQHHFYKFVIFGITEFYTSIKEAFLKKALDFAEAYTAKPGSKKKMNC